MNSQTRNYFLIGLAIVAILGVGLVTNIARSTPNKTTGDSISVSYTLNGKTQTLELQKVSVDAFVGAQFSSGSSKAQNTIVEFADYQCPACGTFATQYEGLFKTKLVDTGKVRYAFRDFPLPQHQNAPLAAEAAACAQLENRFDNYKAILFRSQAEWSNSSSEVAADQFTQYASYVGLNKLRFTECLKKAGAASAIKADMDMGNKVGLTATPSFVVNGYLVSGALPVEAFEAILERVGQ